MWVAGLVMVVPACGGDERASACETDDNCYAGQACRAGRCVAAGDGGASALSDAGVRTDAAYAAIDAWTVPAPDVDAAIANPPEVPSMLAAGIHIEAPFDQSYTAYDLGPVPGTPAGTRYGGCVISPTDPNLLLIGVDSEAPSGSIYRIRVRRGEDGHILAFDGVATPWIDVPYVDANLFYDQYGNLLVTAWNANNLHIVASGADAITQTINLAALGVDTSPGGGAFVPAGFEGQGELRVIGWPSHRWHELTFEVAADQRTYQFATSAVPRSALPVGSGGFAYVPPGSPQVERNSVVVAEWASSVSFFEVDVRGNPDPSTRRPFLTGLTAAWGAYFEPVTGDFIFPSWGNEQMIIIQGFRPPPPPPPPPEVI